MIEFIEMPLETKQGFMEFSGIQNGLWHSEHWRVVHINKDYIIGVQLTYQSEPMIRSYACLNQILFPAEYCGSMKTWVYRGAIVLARASPASPAIISDIEISLEQHGFRQEQFCRPKYQDCTNTRTL